MNWLTRLMQHRESPPVLDLALRETLAHWHTVPLPDLDKNHHDIRYVVLNTHVAGLGSGQEHLLAVAGIAVDHGHIDVANAYYAELDPDPENVLAGLLSYAGSGPVVVFNAGFNRTLLERNIDHHLGVSPGWIWLDLQALLSRVLADEGSAPTSLAQWMDALEIDTFAHFHALGDALAIARLLQVLLARASGDGVTSPRALIELERELSLPA